MIDIDIITGFLGAGKTTFANLLLNYYLSKNEKAVFIVNEFGQTALDAELIQKEGFEAVALSNGCICCTLKNSLLVSLREIVRSFSPTKIVFETSGIFIFDQFMDTLQDEVLKTQCRLNSAITMIDSINYTKSMLLAGGFISNQIKNSSLLVVSKLERFSGDVEGIIADLKQANPKAGLVTMPWDAPGFIENVLANNKAADPGFSEHSHALVDSLTIRSEKDFFADEFRTLQNRILAGEFGSVFRVKGYMRIGGEVCLINISMNDVVLKREERSAQLLITFIGDGLDKANLYRALKD